MPSRIRPVAAALAATALIVPSVALAAGGGGHDHGQTFTLNAVQTADRFVDIDDETGPTTGDQIIFATAVSRDGRPQGVTGGSCTVTTADSATSTFTASCQATARLRGGLITTQALVTFGAGLQRPFTLAITGGSGQYRGAEGEVEVRQMSDTVEDYIVRLDGR